ncbi:MAG: hypothetical protein EOO91_05705 [Pedobacter sp.]|nr:MAG: hypothetical protein EOO91_05705 [Pedobacter sp.]
MHINYLKTLKDFFSASIIFFFFTIVPLLESKELYNYTQSSKLLGFFIGILIVSVLALINLIISTPSFKIKYIDILLLLLFIYVIINVFVINNLPFGHKVYELFILYIFFLFLRQLSRKQYKYALILSSIGAIIQCIIGFLQLEGSITNNSAFLITGNFFNSGPYAGYLASIFPCAVGYFVLKNSIHTDDKKYSLMLKSTFLKIILPHLCLLFFLLVIIFTKSRASWIGIFTSFLYLIYHKKESFILKFTLKKSLLTIIVLISIMGLLYIFKIDSSNGRLFIWKNVFLLIEEEPFFGYGYGNFQSVYMNQQADYFRLNLDSTYSAVADNVHFAFNEFLQCWAEIGFTGIILVSGALLSLFKVNGKDKMLICCKASLIAILTFSMFSYPSQILPIKLNCALFFAIIISYEETIYLQFSFRSPYSRIYRIAIIFICLPLILFHSNYTNRLYQSYKDWALAFRFYKFGNYPMSLLNYSKAFNSFRDNGVFLGMNGKALSMLHRDEEAIEILKLAEKKSNSTVIQIAMGDSYRRLKNYNLSEKSYLWAYYMNPSRLYPQYLLIKLYIEEERIGNALILAKRLVKQKAKIESEASKQIYIEVQKLIDTYEKAKVD